MILDGEQRFDDAIAEARMALDIQPDHWVARNALWDSLTSAGLRDEALAHQRQILARRDSELVAAFERGLAKGGYEGAQRAVADLLVARREASGGFAPQSGWIASTYLVAGDDRRAIDWLERAYEDRDPGLPYISFRTIWDPLRSDPRFQDILSRMNLPSAAPRQDQS